MFRPTPHVQLSVAEIAELLKGEARETSGAPAAFRGLATLAEAQADEISFVVGEKAIKQAPESRAGLLIASEKTDLPGRARIVVKEVWPAIATLMQRLYLPSPPPPGVHPTAIVAETAKLGANASVGPYCVVGEGASIGDGAVLGPHCVIDRDCRVGPGSRLVAQVTLVGIVHLGARVIIHPGAVLGADGFKYENVGGLPYKIPQVGAVIVEDDVEIGANTTIDRAFLHETRIGRFTKLDNLVQIGHNVSVGPASLLAAQVGIAGSTNIGAGCMFGGQSGVADGLKIGDRVSVGAGSKVLASVEANQAVMGWPHVPLRTFFRLAAETQRLPELGRRAREMEKKIAELDARVAAGSK